jgi:hypothetical protein
MPVASGCGSAEDDPAGASTSSVLEARLASDTGVRWLVDRDEANAPLFLSSLTAPPPVAASSPRDQAAIAFLQRYGDFFGNGNLSDELVLRSDDDDREVPGVHHLRFAQRIPGSDVRVFGADDGEGKLPITVSVHAREIDRDGPKGPIPAPRLIDVDAYGHDVIYLGDGVSPSAPIFSAPNCNLHPTGVALDVVSHEFTHGVIDHVAHIGVFGAAGAINEGIADVFGAGVEHSVRPGDHNFVIGEDKWLKQGGTRNIRAPRSLPSTFTGEQMPRVAKEMLPSADSDPDKGHVHDNSIIVSHAYYLMTMGGTNEVTKVTIPASEAMGWASSQRLWHVSLYSIDKASTRTLHDFARVNTAMASFFSKAPTVACAWHAVGVLEDKDLTPFGITCAGAAAPPTPFSPPSPAPITETNICANHGDHLVCDAAAPSSAAVCKNGVRVNVALCADLGQACKRTSASDPTATLDADGALVCE